LKLLDFSNNRLRGELSSHLLANYQEMRVLILGSNEFEGQIPLWITNLTRLQVLDLSNNRLVVTIPSSLEGLKGFSQTESSQLN
ncbi:hypothetical protein SUGI_0836130, partial [Cryptomeria japonica]